MCTLAPVPHLLVLTAPWDAPLQWALFFGGVLVIAGIGTLAAFAFWFRLRRAAHFSRRPTHVPSVFVATFGLLSASGVLFLCGLAMALLVLWPAHERLNAWFASEHARMLAFHCDQSAFWGAYFPAAHTLGTWELITGVAVSLSTAVAVAGGILTAISAIIQSAHTLAWRSPT